MPMFGARVEGFRCALLVVLACSSGVWCGVGGMQIQFKIVLKSSLSSVRLPDRVICQSVQFGDGGQVPPFSSFSSVHSAQFTNSSGSGLIIRFFV